MLGLCYVGPHKSIFSCLLDIIIAFNSSKRVRYVVSFMSSKGFCFFGFFSKLDHVLTNSAVVKICHKIQDMINSVCCIQHIVRNLQMVQGSHGSPAMKFFDNFLTFSWPCRNFYWLFTTRKYDILTFAGIRMGHTDARKILLQRPFDKK